MGSEWNANETRSISYKYQPNGQTTTNHVTNPKTYEKTPKHTYVG